MTIEELFRYLQIMKKRWWAIVILVGATIGTILIIAYTSEPQHQASIRFQVIGTPPSAVSLYDGFRQPSVREEIAYTRSNFLQVLKSYNVARDTLQTVGLGLSPEDLIDKIVVEEVEDSDLIKLSVVADDPQLAADLVNALMNTGLQLYGQLGAQSLTNSREFIAQQLAVVKEDLETSRTALTQFKIENKVSSADALIDSQLALIRLLTVDRDAALVRGDTQQVTTYDKIIAQRQEELQNLFELSAQYEALVEKVRQAETLYNYLSDKETEAKLKENEALNVSFVQVLGPAYPPNRPLSPINFKVLALGAGVSLILGVGLAFVWEYLETASLSTRPSEELTMVKASSTSLGG